MDSPQPDLFERLSPTESICLACYATIRATRSLSLEEAQKAHASECPAESGKK